MLSNIFSHTLFFQVNHDHACWHVKWRANFKYFATLGKLPSKHLVCYVKRKEKAAGLNEGVEFSWVKVVENSWKYLQSFMCKPTHRVWCNVSIFYSLNLCLFRDTISRELCLMDVWRLWWSLELNVDGRDSKYPQTQSKHYMYRKDENYWWKHKHCPGLYFTSFHRFLFLLLKQKKQ